MGPRNRLSPSYLGCPQPPTLKKILTPAPQSTGQQDAQSTHFFRPRQQALHAIRISTGHQHATHPADGRKPRLTAWTHPLRTLVSCWLQGPRPRPASPTVTHSPSPLRQQKTPGKSSRSAQLEGAMETTRLKTSNYVLACGGSLRRVCTH